MNDAEQRFSKCLCGDCQDTHVALFSALYLTNHVSEAVISLLMQQVSWSLLPDKNRLCPEVRTGNLAANRGLGGQIGTETCFLQPLLAVVRGSCCWQHISTHLSG